MACLTFPPIALPAALLSCAAAAAATVRAGYTLPVEGPLPRTYRVTLAAAPADEPDWIVSTFVAGAPRTVTKENRGRFTEEWDGLDDNFMPVPPGDYAIKGIFMPARRWAMDGRYHTLIARYRLAAGDSWAPRPEAERGFPWVFGHVFGGLRDVAVGSNGKAGFWFNYIENSWNPFLVDMRRPVGHGQVVARYPSGGAAGGPAVACDGERLWCASDNGGAPFVFSRTLASFGSDRNRYGVRCRLLKALPQSMTARRDPGTGRTLLYVTQDADGGGSILVLDGTTGQTLAEKPIARPTAVTLRGGARGGTLAALSSPAEGRFLVRTVALEGGLPAGEWRHAFEVSEVARPSDLEAGDDGTWYVCDAKANRACALDARGRLLREFGGKGGQKLGRYDAWAFMSPSRLAFWTDARGRGRLLVVEAAGPRALTEWAADGSLLRQWCLAQNAAHGYCMDPDEPRHMYAVCFSRHLVRYEIDYAKATWKVDAVWPMPLGGSQHPRVVNVRGRKYIAFAGGAHSQGRFAVYRIEGYGLVPSAGIVPDKKRPKGERIKRGFFWHDADGDGRVEEAEYVDGTADLPHTNYWGERWLADLSLVIFTPPDRFMRLAPSRFDTHGNPVYEGSKWETLLRDPIPESRKRGTDALHGGNELPIHYNLHWIHMDGSAGDGFYVADSFGRNNPGGVDTAGGYFSQVKLSRYAPDGEGGYRPVWRVGRKAFRLAEPGQMYASHYFAGPAYDLVGVFDSNGIYHVFNGDGLYLDTLGVDAFRHGLGRSGMYAGSGESWYGAHYLNSDDGKVYLFMGRAQMTVHEVENWKAGVVEPLAVEPRRIRLTAAGIGRPHPVALKLRGGERAAPSAEFRASPGGAPALDGSMRGWETAPAVRFGLDRERAVEVRGMFDRTHLYLRWRVRLPGGFSPVEAGDLTRVFTHETGADTVSFYMQCDPDAPPGGERGRPGDVRFVFAVVRAGAGRGGGTKAIVLGMYPERKGEDPANPVTYSSPVREASFAHVALVEDARLGHLKEEDGRGFILAASIPVDAIPMMNSFSPRFQTLGNFAATLGGVTNFWWANTGNVVNTNTTDEPSEAELYPASWAPIRFAF